MDLPEVTKTEVIRVEDGDVLAVFVKGHHHLEALEDMKSALAKQFLPKKIGVVIINAEVVELKVMRAE